MTCVHCSTSKKTGQTQKTPKAKTEEASRINLSLEDRLRRLSGVNIQGSGRDAKVTIRGLNSLTNNTEALFVVDGTVVPGGLQAVSQLVNVNDIKDIEVLKSAIETSAYGIQGAGGVIVIRLKKD
jgi:outer membrane cobalamin receptor